MAHESTKCYLQHKMKKLFGILLLILSMTHGYSAVNIYRVKVPFTSNPVDGDTITVNGVVLTFKTVTSSPSTQVLIGATATDTALNYYNHQLAGAYPYSRIAGTLTGTQVDLYGEISFVITASRTGAWGPVTVTIVPFTQHGLVLPLSGEPAATRQPMADALVDAFAFAVNTMPAASAAFANFMNLSTVQTITGDKTFSGVLGLANGLNLYNGGALTNITFKKVLLKNDGTHANGILTYNLSAVRFGIAAPDASGFLTFYDAASGEIPAPGNEFNTTGLPTTSGTYLWRGLADTRYGQLGAANTWTAANIFNGATTLANFTGVGTNLTLGAHQLWVDTDFVNSGTMALSNAAPTFYYSETGAAANKGRYRILVDAGTWNLDVLNDDGTLYYRALSLNRNPATPSLNIANFIADGGGSMDGPSYLLGATYQYGKLYVGVNAPPTDTTGVTFGIGLMNSSSTGSGDPSNGTMLWSFGSEMFYRTATASEGAGGNFRLHNRTGSSAGSGSAYNLTASYAQVVNGVSHTVVLPTVGTYLLFCTVAVDEDPANANDAVFAKLFNSTDAVDITGSEKNISNIPAAKRGQITIVVPYTLSAGATRTIQIYAKNQTAARGSIDAAQTSLIYARMF
jgi:hypothetical protein